MAAVREVLAEIGAAGRARARRREQGRPGARGGQGAGPLHRGVGADLGPHRRGHRRPARASSATACAATDRVVRLVVPWSRGDVLAAVHREGEVVGQSDGEDAATLQVVLDESAGPASAEFVAAP